MKKFKLYLIGILSFLGGIAYRLGGKEGWNTKFRDIGVSFISCLLLVLLGGVHTFKEWLSLIPSFGLMFAALTTYRYFLPKPKDCNYKWYHYSLHGFFVSLSSIPYVWVRGNWIWFSISCIICAFGVGLWSHLIGWDELEESGRGFIIVVTRSLLVL